MPLLSAQSVGSLRCPNISSYETTESLTNLNSSVSYLTKPDMNEVVNCSTEHLQSMKRHREKCHVVKEILSSEKKYIADIKEIVEGYYDEISKAYVDNQEFIYHIFSNICEIFEFTKAFYAMLEAASTKDEIAIANCFIRKHRMFSKLYSTYCQNYKIAHSTTERLEKDASIGKIIQKVRNKYGHSLKMATYLQLPVLRITKYHLLLQRYLKAQEKDSIAYRHVMDALELMRQVNDQINRDMPEFDENENSKENYRSSNLTTLNLTSLFGSVLKQGYLLMTESSTTHHVVVFQTMFLIRQSDCNSKIINTITNDSLGFSPITVNSGLKNWKKCFSVIDYNQNKSENICQFTFRANSSEEKKSWQSAILSCMLNGYGKKISENIKKKVMKLDQEAYAPKFESIKMKLSNFKRNRDLKYTFKNDFKNTSCQNFEEFESKLECQDPNTTAPASSMISSMTKRRISEPFKSPLFNMLSKRYNENNTSKKSLDTVANTGAHTAKTDISLQNVFKKLYKTGKYGKKKLNLSGNLSQSQYLTGTTNTTFSDGTENSDSNNLNKNTAVEIKLNDFEIIYQHMDSSFDLIQSDPLNDTTVSKFEKFINKKIATSEDKPEFIYDSSTIKRNKDRDVLINQKILDEHLMKMNHNTEIYESSLSSKSSINSEEGYYSNHDSSVSTLINEIQSDENLKKYDLQKIISTPESQRKRLTDSSSDQFSSSSSSTHDQNNNNIIHIEIINNFESSNLDNEPAYLFNNSITEQNLKYLDECRCRKKDSLRLEKNEVIFNNGDHDLTSFNRIQKYRYQKANVQRKRRNLSEIKLNPFQIHQTQPIESSISAIKLDQPTYKYEKFSRNLNTSIASLYDNASDMAQNNESNVELSQSILSNSALNNLSYATSYIDKSFNEPKLGNIKCKSLGCLIDKDKLTNLLGASLHEPKESNNKMNVKDLISKFENR